MALAACSRTSGSASPEVVLYSSVDDYVLREFVRQFEQDTGIRVRLVGDTEATKTTGLVQRLLQERDEPRADVWWSSEPFGTVRLVRAGVLEPYDAFAGGVLPEGWPDRLRGADDLWFGFAQRARVIASNTNTVASESVPRSIAELADSRWRGRVGIARPQFGTTRGHVAWIAQRHGEAALEAWLTAMVENDVRVYDGNATALRAVAQGEVDLCLTDTDDVWAGQRLGWPVRATFAHASPADDSGPLLLPNTAGLVLGGPNPEHARTLLQSILSERTERMLAESDSRNLPVRTSVAEALAPRYRLPVGVQPADADFVSVAAAMERAMDVCRRVLP